MTGTLVGYTRCSTDSQDLTARPDRLRELGVSDGLVYVDHGMTGTKRTGQDSIKRWLPFVTETRSSLRS